MRHMPPVVMRVYLAGPYAARRLIHDYSLDLLAEGIACSSTWLDEVHEIGAGTIGAASSLSAAVVAGHAKQDLDAIDRSDVVVLFTAAAVGIDGAAGTTGGRHVETGYAIAREKPVIVVGDPENVFHRLPTACTCVPSWEDALHEVKRLRTGGP